MLRSLRSKFSETRAVAEINSGGTDVCTMRIGGEWSIQFAIPSAQKLVEQIAAGAPATIAFETSELKRYDSSLVAFLLNLRQLCEGRKIALDLTAFPEGVKKLLELALARKNRVNQDHIAESSQFFVRLGEWGLQSKSSWEKAFSFIGETVIAAGNFARGKARTRFSECRLLVQVCGADALPIVALISFLTGLILAYVGAVQMKQFGATVYVANLVGLAMVREMGVLMASIILCGRTATAFAAQLGSMQGSEEIAAFRVLGISPIEYLVLPRMIALMLMLPFLTLYADLFGILGGLVVATSMDITAGQYWHQIISAINMPNFTSGIIKSFFFAVLIAGAGCFRGMVAGKSAQSVGDAATSAAVLGITLVIVADAVFAVLFEAISFF